MALPRGAAALGASGVTKGKRGEDDDDHVIPASLQVPAVRGTAWARLKGRTRAGRKGWVGWLVAAYSREIRFFLYRLTPISYIIQI
jgi:hypothetical protein